MGVTSMKQRILHIIDTLDRTGTAQQLSLLARGLPQDEFEVHAAALQPWRTDRRRAARAGIPVHVIGRRWSADPATFWRLVRHVQDLRPESIVAWQAMDGPMRRRQRTLQRAVARGRMARIQPDRWPLQATIDRSIGRQACTVVASCPAVRDRCVQQGIAAEKIKIIPGVRGSGTRRSSRGGQILDRLGLPNPCG